MHRSLLYFLKCSPCFPLTGIQLKKVEKVVTKRRSQGGLQSMMEAALGMRRPAFKEDSDHEDSDDDDEWDAG